jgi:hypothetical protein
MLDFDGVGAVNVKNAIISVVTPCISESVYVSEERVASISGARSKPCKKPAEVGSKMEVFPPKRQAGSELRNSRRILIKNKQVLKACSLI